MAGKNASRWAGLALALGLAPASAAAGSEPPSSKVARWHDQLCPRDLTPVVTGPYFGYYPTRWRCLPIEPLTAECAPGSPGVPAVLPSQAKAALPAGKPTVAGPSPYGIPAASRPTREEPKAEPRGDWAPKPAAGRVVPSGHQAPAKKPVLPDDRERALYPGPEPAPKR
jgi:hypothetical protein